MLLRASDEGSPAKRALRTPGAPPSASTQMPESSASAGSPLLSHACRALTSAFSMNVGCGSSASPMPSSTCDTTSNPSGSSRRRNSRNFPALFDARTRRTLTTRALRAAPRAVARSPLGERQQHVELRTRERLALGGALYFDETPRAHHHDVH